MKTTSTRTPEFAYLTMKTSSFARFARAFSIFVHFALVRVSSTSWNDLFYNSVEVVSTWTKNVQFFANLLTADANLIKG